MAIKLSKALEMNFDSFKQFNIETNQKLKDAYAQNKSFKHDPILPKVDIIFEKNYHFMNESLLEKQLRKQKRLEKKSQLEAQNKAQNEDGESHLENDSIDPIK